MGFPQTRAIALGIVSVIGRKRLPCPAASMTAFIGL